MAKTTKTISTYKDLPLDSTLQFVGWVDPKRGGSRWKQDNRSKTWNFVVQLVAWQVNQGPVIRERMFIRKSRLDNSGGTRLIRQTPKGRLIQFKGSRPKDSASLSKQLSYVKLAGPIETPPKSLAIGKDAGIGDTSKPVVFKDPVFGTLKLNRDFDYFETDASFRGMKMNVTFNTESIEELKELIERAKPLWKKRQAWFSAWRKKIYRYYMANEWWQEDYKLTEKAFYRLLEWPVGVEFSLADGEFYYSLSGDCEELFTDHGIYVHGSSISKMDVD